MLNNSAIADSGCTSHFLGNKAHCTNKKPCAQGVIVNLPNNMTMQATHTALLDHPNIPIEARQCHIFPDMGSKALLSIAQFVDHGYKAVLKPTSISMVHETNPDLSFEGGRDEVTRMWTIDLHSRTQPSTQHGTMQINSVYELSLKQDIIKYLHRAAGSPTTATWCAAIANSNYAT